MITACKAGVDAGEVETAADSVHPGVQGLRTGAHILGIGVAISLVSIPLIYAIIGLFTLTAGVIMMGIGLLYLFFSSLFYVSQD